MRDTEAKTRSLPVHKWRFGLAMCGRIPCGVLWSVTARDDWVTWRKWIFQPLAWLGYQFCLRQRY